MFAAIILFFAASALVVTLFPYPKVAGTLTAIVFVILALPGILLLINTGRLDRVVAPIILTIPYAGIVYGALALRRWEMRSDKTEPLSKRRRSVWTWLWLAFAMYVWAVGAWTLSQGWSMRPPAANAESEQICSFDLLVRERVDTANYVIARECANDPVALAAARSRLPSYRRRFWEYLAVTASGYLLLPFAVAGLWIGCVRLMRRFLKKRAHAG